MKNKIVEKLKEKKQEYANKLANRDDLAIQIMTDVVLLTMDECIKIVESEFGGGD